MDGRRFDAWSRVLAERGGTRRQALRLLAGAAGAGLLARLGLAPEGTGACRAPGRQCDRNRQCCSGICKRRRCRCNDGRRACGAAGSCCAEGAKCRNGQCLGQCAAGEDICLGFSACSNQTGCQCTTKMADGATACGKLAAGCTPCTDDAGCAAFGAGAFCSKKTGTSCCTNLAVGQGFCSLPCPT